MPPAQCPACGRFLKRAFVTALAEQPAPCPGCDEELRPESFAAGEGPVDPDPTDAVGGDVTDAVGTAGVDDPGPAEDPMTAEQAGTPAAEQADAAAAPTSEPVVADPSIRPPDLEPTTVRDHEDVLHGWDRDTSATGLWTDRRPFPTDTVIVGGAAAAGAAAGIVLARRRGGSVLLGALGGLLVGGVTAGVGRRVWHLEG